MTQVWLAGWQQIGDYLHIHWRTAHKYHVEYGLPVLRKPSGQVLALPAEIDAWLMLFNKKMEAENIKPGRNRA